MTTPTVLVLHGGRSAEREVSLASGAAVAEALRGEGHAVELIDADQSVAALAATLEARAANGPIVVFNALHGRFGEDGTVQGLLDLMRIPYTHSGRLASALAMDKPMAKQVFAQAGLPVAEHRIVPRDSLRDGDPLPRPYVVKPIDEGSSVGVWIVRPETDSLAGLDDDAALQGEQVMVERFVPGRELTISVMGTGGSAKALCVTEIVAADGGFYDYAAKYTAEKAARHVVPAPLSEAETARALEIAVTAHRVLGCTGVSRADLRYDGAKGLGGMILLEVNTQPGMTAMSLVPEQAAHLGMSFGALCSWMVEDARCRA